MIPQTNNSRRPKSQKDINDYFEKQQKNRKTAQDATLSKRYELAVNSKSNPGGNPYGNTGSGISQTASVQPQNTRINEAGFNVTVKADKGNVKREVVQRPGQQGKALHMRISDAKGDRFVQSFKLGSGEDETTGVVTLTND